MQQVKMIGLSKIILENIKIPVPKENEVLLKVKYAGICGSDIVFLNNESYFKTFYSSPIVIGHEICGEVVSDGKKFRKGERVIVYPILYCGKCNFCRKMEYNLCEAFGFVGYGSENGGFAEYMKIKEGNLFKVPNGMPDETAVMIEPISVAYHIAGLIKPNRLKSIMIFGAGNIGIILIRILKKKYGINNITAIDIYDEKLILAEKSGASKIVNMGDKNWKNKVAHKIQMADGPYTSSDYDAVIDFVTSSYSIDIGISNLRKKGILVVPGHSKEEIKIDKIPFSMITTNELSIKGSQCYTHQDFLDTIEMMGKKEIDVNDLISTTFDLSEIQTAIEEWKKNYSSWHKVLLKP